MAKTRVKTAYICQNCGYSSPKWMGRCPNCGEWNTMVETVMEREKRPRPSVTPTSEPQPLPPPSAEGFERIPVPIGELSRVLGGGIVPGSVVLIGGDP